MKTKRKGFRLVVMSPPIRTTSTTKTNTSNVRSLYINKKKKIQQQQLTTTVNNELPSSKALSNTYVKCISVTTTGTTTTTTQLQQQQQPKALKHKRRYCREVGCDRIVKSQGLCQRHGAKPKKCKIHDCSKQSQGSYNGMCSKYFFIFVEFVAVVLTTRKCLSKLDLVFY